jgi:hypothetical protein
MRSVGLRAHEPETTLNGHRCINDLNVSKKVVGQVVAHDPET